MQKLASIQLKVKTKILIKLQKMTRADEQWKFKTNALIPEALKKMKMKK